MEQVTFRPITSRHDTFKQLDAAARSVYDLPGQVDYVAETRDGSMALAYARQRDARGRPTDIAILMWTLRDARQLVKQHNAGIEGDLDAQEYDVEASEVSWNADGSFTVQASASLF